MAHSFRPAEGLPQHHGGGGEFKRHDTKESGRPRPGNQTVFARLQSLFPNSASSPRTAEPIIEPESVMAARSSSRPPPRFLKVRVISWNMHDSLPKGNLEDLLGAVPPYVPCPEDETDKLRIPNMSAEDGHPYHLVVVAGQECPTSSGIPMGLGASFRHKDRDRTKDSDKSAKKAKGKDGKEKYKDEAYLQEGSTSTPTGDVQSVGSSHGQTSGWSWILEEWYCHGHGQRNADAQTSSASELYDSQATGIGRPQGSRLPALSTVSGQKEGDNTNTTGKENKKDGDKKHSHRCKDCKDATSTGPYELLVKDRLMGIYMAVFVYRDVMPLVRGVTSSSVTTGLIGGRVGNKGGVGVSINIDGTTLLFINAHLAAHENRLMNRVTDFQKIKTELQVNDFLSLDDPRVMAEDLTDKFDFTFLFGDLNFRLDVTRLHADWLITRKDYEQAFTFDQLQGLIRNGQAFVGFKEAPIHFPPTFKYDVLKTLRRDKMANTLDLSRALSSKRWLGGRSNQSLSELQEGEMTPSTHLVEEERGESLDAEEDNGSFVSTAVTATSVQSRSVLDVDSGDHDHFLARSNSPRFSNKSKGDGGSTAVEKLFIAKAAHKAKEKWLSLVKPNVSGPPVTHSASQRSDFSASFPQLKARSTSMDDSSTAFRAASSALELSRARAPNFNKLGRTSSRKSAKSSRSSKLSGHMKAAEKLHQESEGGVYDSSSKQRVPSWCDRILWKTTVKPEPESDDEEELTLPGQHTSGLGPRMLAFLSQALRPLSSRSRTISLTSLPSRSAADASQPLLRTDASRPLTSRPDSQPLMSQPSLSSEKESALGKVKTFANMVNIRQLTHRKARHPKLMKSRSTEPTSTTPLMPSNQCKRRSRAYTAMPMISAPTVALPDDSTLVSDLGRSKASQQIPPTNRIAGQRSTSARGWLRLQFLGRETEAEPLASDIILDSPPHKSEATPSKPHRPRRGEVVAVEYDSLDDQAMRRLEGRSDHRPVIGSYIIYI